MKLLVTALLLVLAGCVAIPHQESEQARRMQYVEAHPEMSQKSRERVLAGLIGIGMTAEEVLASSGRPSDTNRTATDLGLYEVWWYGHYGEGRVVAVHFRNGVVTSWDESN